MVWTSRLDGDEGSGPKHDQWPQRAVAVGRGRGRATYPAVARDLAPVRCSEALAAHRFPHCNTNGHDAEVPAPHAFDRNHDPTLPHSIGRMHVSRWVRLLENSRQRRCCACYRAKNRSAHNCDNARADSQTGALARLGRPHTLAMYTIGAVPRSKTCALLLGYLGLRARSRRQHHGRGPFRSRINTFFLFYFHETLYKT
jgi:hypothetical protein